MEVGRRCVLSRPSPRVRGRCVMMLNEPPAHRVLVVQAEVVAFRESRPIHAFHRARVVSFSKNRQPPNCH